MTLEHEISNRVREFRELRGLSQCALAELVGVARQSLHAIETGRSSPSVDLALRLARVLDSSVETLFGIGCIDDTELRAEPVIGDGTGRVTLAQISGRWLSFALNRDRMGRSADGIGQTSRSKALKVIPLRPAVEAKENLVIMGCAPALGLLVERLNSKPGSGRFNWFSQSSTRALEALNQRNTHVAGVHLVDAKTGEVNVPDVRRCVTSCPVALITLAKWEVGLVTAKHAPSPITKLVDLARKGVRLAAREPGSGARRLLERELKRSGLSSNLARKAEVVASGHLEVAQAIALGVADVGIATRDAALAYDLAFIPLTEERYDLAIATSEMRDPRIERMLDVLTTAPLRRELEYMGYDVECSGTQVA